MGDKNLVFPMDTLFLVTGGAGFIGSNICEAVLKMGQDPNGAYAAVIPKFIKQLLAGERPTINGDGRQSRDFTYIENVIEANLKACLAPDEAAGEAFNVAYGGREYLIDIYYTLIKALGKTIEPRFGSERKGDIKHSNADISKAKRILGYAPEWSFERGISAAID